jgi:glutathione synthase/RimK-type ligase-like ATP-grasp enzyme
MATVGVLCARGRVEEKTLMAALAEASIVSALFPPADEPLPVGPLPISPDGRAFPVPQLVVDRHPNRQAARAVLATCRALGVPVLSAGIAATGDRLDVASALSVHGLPRPATALCTSEEAALAAVTATGLPATLLPLDLQDTPIALLDLDAAEAILEHRAVLGGAERSLALVQSGAPSIKELYSVIVVDGVATAVSTRADDFVAPASLRTAEETARALGAELIAVVIAQHVDGPVVWDVQPVPEFRHALSLTGESVAQTIARAVQSRLELPVVPGRTIERNPAWITVPLGGVRGGVVVSA